MGKVLSKTYGPAPIEILKLIDTFTAITLMVSDEGVAEEDGRKIVKAGSILDVNGKVVNDETARYVLLRPVDVTNGPNNGAGLIHGFVDLEKIPTKPSPEAVAALRLVLFLDESYNY